MGLPTVGDVVLAVFPFSNLQDTKLRPCLVIAEAEFGNSILCQITSKAYSSKRAIPIQPHDFAGGSLQVISYIRPDKLFTADSSLIKQKVGTLQKPVTYGVLLTVRQLFDKKQGDKR